MEGFWQDLRFALRGLRKSPGFAVAAVLSIGLGVGVNTVVFTWMEGLILNPYPAVRDAGQLVGLNSVNPGGTGSGEPPISYPSYLGWREATRSFDGMAVFNSVRLNMRIEGEQQVSSTWGQLVSDNYFDVLGVPAMLGRTFSPGEEANAARVAVLSHSCWQRSFASDRSVIGRHVLLNGVDVTIVGVATPRFAGTVSGLGYDLWTPVTLQPELTAGGNRLTNRGDRWLQGFARLKPGVSLTQAREEMMAVARRISEANGERPVTGAEVKRMREQFLGSLLSPLFSALLAVTGLVLLTACANVANLLLARAAFRRKEIGIRMALGAKRGRLVRQLLTESLLLSLAGGTVGLLLALWGRDLFMAFIPPVSQPVAVAIEMNARIVGFALLVTLATAVVFGLAPALRASKPDLIPLLKNDGGAGNSRSKLRGALAVAQVALSLVSLVCAGLFLRSLQQARTMDLGFADPGHLLLVTTDLKLAGPSEASGLALTERLLEQVRALPGVRAASVSTMVPLGFGGHSFSGTKIEGYTPPLDERPSTERVIVGPDYFETMGIPVLIGRGIARRDTSDGLRVAVVNDAFVRRYWPGEDAIGKRLDQGNGWATVVGVAADSKYQDLGESAYPVVYSPLSQRYTAAFTLHVRTEGEPRALIETVRSEFTSIDAGLPFLDPRTMTEHISAASFVQFIGASMLSGFGGLTLLLAALGIYGVLSYTVNQRKRELAIRIALGAGSRDVMRLVLGQGIRLTVIGLAIGAGVAFAAGRLLGSQLLGVTPADPAVFLAVALLLAVVAMIACVVPASRAARVDPVTVLKSE